MAIRFEKVIGERSPDVIEAWGPYQEHMLRLQSELKDFLSGQEARETATYVCKLAFDIDEEIARILKDPMARRLYNYDGQFFTPRGTGGFHTAFDGFHLLNWLNDSMLTTFFRGREKYVAIRWLLEELEKHAWAAQRRRMNWEELHTLDLVPRDVLETIIEHTWMRQREASEGPSPLSCEERAFFQSFEEQMAENPSSHRCASHVSGLFNPVKDGCVGTLRLIESPDGSL